MMSEFTLMGDAFALRLATTLLHFVWQGLLLAIVAAVAGRTLHKASASTRYSINVCTLFAMLVCLPTTFFVLGGSVGNSKIQHNVLQATVSDDQPRSITAVDAGPKRQQAEDALKEEQLVQITLPGQLERLENVLIDAGSGEEHLPGPTEGRRQASPHAIIDIFALAPIVTWGYFAGVLFMTIRLATGLRGGRDLRRSSSPVVDTGLLAMIQTQARVIGLKCAPAVAFCEKISVPIVIGVVQPMILLPASLVSGLSPDQLQALVTHELAHIRRHDLLINLLQRIVEALLFFHPAVWFVSRRISIERENVADDVVLTAGWPAVRYADALVRMAELSSGFKTPDLTIQMSALAASGSSSSEFKRRVIRLLDQSSSSRLRLSRFGIVAMTLGIVSLLAMPLMVQLAADEQPAAEQVSPEGNNAVESAVESDAADILQSDEELTDAKSTVKPPRIVEGFVTGPKGAIADVKVKVTLTKVDPDSKASFSLAGGKTVKTLDYRTNENGRYRIEIPGNLASDTMTRVTVELSHSEYLGRKIGPLAVSDFDNNPLRNNQPYWLARQMGRQAIRHSRLRTAHHLSGRILLPDGRPAVGARVRTATKYRAYSWKRHSPDDYGASDEAITDSNGQFSITTDKPASFTAMMPGQSPLIIDDLTKRISLANGDEPNEFRLPPATRIQGRVITAEGKPVPRAIIRARRDFAWNEFDMPLSFSIWCAADEMGYYELPPLPADQYQLSVDAQLAPESRPEVYNKVMGSFGTIPQPKFDTQPIDLVFVPKKMSIEQFSPGQKIDLRAVPMVTLRVNVEFPDGTPDPNRQTDVGISGTFNGKEWNGQYALADKNGIATLRAPKGLDWAFIKTGLARHRRSKDSDEEIG